MENKETIIKILGLSEKTSKGGRKYYSVETEQGSYTIFDKPIIEELKALIGKSVKVEIVESDKGFMNIRKVLGESEEKASKYPGDYHDENFADARAEKNRSIYASYAKDLFIELLYEELEMNDNGVARETDEAIMKRACLLVNIAANAF